MNTNEPVAWMETHKGELNNLDWDKSNLNYGSEFHDVIPLYTHPAKTLTDEEIVEIINEYRWRGLTGYLLTFARAILKKASE